MAAWYAAGALDHEGLARAQALTPAAPTAQDWRRFWRDTAGWLAALLLASAIVCFVAANWSRLGPGVRLGGVQALLVGAALAAWPARASRRLVVSAMFVGCVLIGVLLALIGQTYQTGADPWTLFAFWTLLMLPWALAARAVPVWWLVVAVANVGLMLWSDLYLARNGTAIAFGALNGGALVAWELSRRRWPAWDVDRLGVRVLATVLMLGVTATAMAGRFEWRGMFPWVPLGVWIAVSVGLLSRYRRKQQDLYIVAVWLLSAWGLGCVYIGGWLIEAVGVDMLFLWVVLALLLLGAAGVGVRWLTALARETRA